MAFMMQQGVDFKYIVVLVSISFSVFEISAQTSAMSRQANLDTLFEQSSRYSATQSQRAREYARKNRIPLTCTDEFRTSMLVGIDDFGLPIFIATDNTKAAITTGVPALRINGSLGLNLEGAGMRVGVWDGGKVAHVEFGNRIISTEGATNDTHATHVTGTIAAGGLNPDAKGMAPKTSIVSFDFINDVSEMASLAKPDQSGLIISNHSYGLVTGWDCTVTPCQWRGNPSVSVQEDYRFGFYSNNTRSWDLISNNAPYYTIVKSVGNDRSSGSGALYPPDCNGGSGYDCIEEKAAAKNILTIGAVNPVLNYIDSSSVLMSAFSSWGPTDDGRIKPDVVGDGVNVFSTVLNNSYGVLSGTSMSSPNATGSLILIQELYRKLNGGNFMLSSTLKALTIHTAKRTGLHPGPDYRFGWGLLDVAAAAKVLINNDNNNTYVLELDLKNGETFNLPLSPKANQKITATLVWNDPAGTPPSISLDPTGSMLVNDLDIRISDDQENVQFPWALNPETNALGQAAYKADNFRDNVEKIEFKNPEQRNYNLRVNHKRTLLGGIQKFSLIISYSSIREAPQSLYWIGNSGDWSDPTHWSLTSGGSSANVLPNLLNNVIFDENSFSNAGTVSFSNPASCQSLLLLASSEKVGFALNSNTLNLSGNFTSSDTTFSITSFGNIQFSAISASPASIRINGSDFSLGKFIFDGNSFALIGLGKLGELSLRKGSLDLSNTNFQIKNLNSSTSSSKTLNLNNAVITGIELSNLNVSDNLISQTDSTVIVIPQTSSSQFNWSGIYLKGTIIIQRGSVTINGNNRIHRIRVDGALRVNGDNQFSNITMAAGASISFSDNSTQTMSRNTVFESNLVSRSSIQSTGLARLSFEGQYKLCFDYLNISGITIVGSASVNAGLHSSLTNANNWVQEDCQNVLLTDFEVTFPCVGGQTRFVDKSQGLILNYLWDFGERSVVFSGNTSSTATATFMTEGTYQVRLTVSNSKFSKSFQREVVIGPNDLKENQIVINNLNLFSKEFAPAYQWFKDNNPIQGAILRSFPFNGDQGSYSILATGPLCNRLSPILIITDLPEEEVKSNDITIFPNPASGLITIVSESKSEMNIRFFNSVGQSVMSSLVGENSRIMDISGLVNGIYFVLIEIDTKKYRQKLLINR